MKHLLWLFLLGFFLVQMSLANEIKVPEDNWVYPYLTQAASYELTCPWFNQATKEASRLDIAQILSKYLVYMEKQGLIAKKPDVPNEEFGDVPDNSPMYLSVKRVVSQYGLLQTSRSNELYKGEKMPIGEFAVVLSKSIALNDYIKMDKAELTRTVKRQIMDNFSDIAFKENAYIRRQEVIAAVVKSVDFVREQQRLVLEQKELEKKEAAHLGEFPNQILLGGMFGQVQEKASSTNSSVLLGGELIFEKLLAPQASFKFLGSGSAYEMQYLIPSSLRTAQQVTVKETKYDAQFNYKNLLSQNFMRGNISSVFGFRSLFLKNGVSDSSLLGLRGGLEYASKVMQKVEAKIECAMTAKLYSEVGSSVIGAPTSLFDYGIGAIYSFSPDSFLSLNYEGDALVFNQAHVRYSNLITLKSGWRL